MEIGLDLEGDGMYYVCHVMHVWCHGSMAVSVAEVGERPSFISLSHCDGMHPNLLGERDSMCGDACIILSHPRDGLQEGTHTASQEGCCGVWTDGWTVVRQDGTRWGQTGVGQMVTSW